IEEERCYICGNSLEYMIEKYSRSVADLILQEGLSSFLIGILPSKDMVSREKEVAKELKLKFWESVKNELKREIGKRVRDLTNINPNFEDPDATIIIDMDRNTVRIEIPSLLFFGTYWKLGRRISQVPWIKSDGTKKYPLSIEEILQKAAELVNAERAIFHAAGREDVDVRMLGSGRPFVLELYKPKKRSIDMKLLEQAVNNLTPWIKISLDMRVHREFIAKIKSSATRGYKIYRALVATRNPIDSEDLKNLEEFFKNRVIEQWTPLRVIKRRKNILRRRRVLEVKTLQLDSNIFEALIKCEGGLYVKELISGDLGRTTPSFSEVLKTEATCIELDVVYVQKYI
ncbi:MAG TPA: tRNA pseudouridine(54/55) synthase Pus10, partial [Ignisphaera sp.]|nr:tRNA pseudouridine(54/55) synthase Pus10 [Ignisphaera sp.]